jgi:hypothetical protein
MNSQHRTKGFAALSVALALVYTFAPSSAFAQQRGRSATPRTSTSSSAARPTDDKAAARRAQAINLLVETANSARTFNDLLYRARIQALAADALWSFDEARARLIFRRAWEAAADSDRAEERAAAEDAGVSSNPDEVTLTAARDEVLVKAAARDAKLADAFLRELIQERDRADVEKNNQSTRRTAWRELSPSGARRLALAYELLNQGSYSRSAQVAEPLINEGVSGDFMEFLLRFRFRLSSRNANDPSGADGSVAIFLSTLYTRLVEKTAADPYADANDLLLLSSFIISPNLLMAVDEKGGLQFRSLGFAPVNNNPPGSVAFKPFYNLAVSVLLQRSFLSRRAASSAQDRIARYVATGRLLPFFEQAGPQYAQFVPAMRSQLSVLSGEMEKARRDALDAQFELTSLNRKNLSDPLAPQLEQLTRAVDKAERDRISLDVVRKAAREKLWDRAQRAAYSIEDGDMRRAALSFIVVIQIADISRAYRDDKEDDFESIARFVRRADAPPFASAWGLAQAAVVAARKKGSREVVSALLSEAESYAARADKDSRQRVAAYVVITDAAARVDTARAWDFFPELVRAVNATGDYMGDETTLPTSADSVEGSLLQEELRIEADAFRLDRIFATMARIDFDKTLIQAQALTGEIPRAYARLAAARAALEK